MIKSKDIERLQRLVIDSQTNPVFTEPLDMKDIPKIHELIISSLDRISSYPSGFLYYSQETLEGLKSLYTIDELEKKVFQQDNELWVTRNCRDKIKWVMELKPYSIEQHSQTNPAEGGIEIKMFYGDCKRCAIASMVKAKQRVLDLGLSYLSGNVLKPAWNFFELMGEANGKINSSGSYVVREINTLTQKPFPIEVKYFQLRHGLEDTLYNLSVL